MAQFAFNTRKMIEASATLLRLEHSRTMGRKRLLALLYLADRQSLQETGRPIIGGRLVAMKHGPIHSAGLDIIQGTDAQESEWSNHFSNDAYRVCLTRDPGTHALSRYEVGVLDELTKKYAGSDDWDVANATHELREYMEVQMNGKVPEISFEALIDAVNRTADKQTILKDAEEKRLIDGIFPQRI